MRKNLHRQQSGFAAEYDSLYRMVEEFPLQGIPQGFFHGFPEEIAKYGGGRTADHGIHGIKFICKVRRQKNVPSWL